MLADGLFSLLSLFYSERQQYNKILQNIKPGEAGGGGRGARHRVAYLTWALKVNRNGFRGLGS